MYKRQRRALAAAVDAFEPRDGICGFHAAYERGDALRVSGTAAREGYAADNALFQFDVDLPGTGPDGGIGYVLGHGV